MRRPTHEFPDRKKSNFGLVGALLLATLLTAPERARACSPPGIPSVMLGSSSVPSDGLIAGIISDCESCELGDLYVERIGEGGAMRVPGRLVDLPSELAGRRWIAFRPDQPLTPGAHYIVHVPNLRAPYWSEPATFHAVAAANVEPSVSVYKHAERVGVDPVECAVYDGSVGGLCSAPVFYERSARFAQLLVTVTGANVGQRAYRIVWTADGAKVHELSAQTGEQFTHTFTGTPRSVCFELFARPLLEGPEQHIGGECLSTANDELGEIPGSFGEQTETLRSCMVPPKGYEQAWCDTLGNDERRREECGDEDDEDDSTGDPAPKEGKPSFGCAVHATRGATLPGEIHGAIGALSLAALSRRRKTCRVVSRTRRR